MKRVPLLLDREEYINDCCIGGDVVLNHVLPAIRGHYGAVEPTQEDWGWFLWFRKGGVRLAIDVFADDPGTGAFRVHLTSRTKRLLVLESIVDTAELEELRALVTSQLSAWVDGPIQVTALDPKYLPKSS